MFTGFAMRNIRVGADELTQEAQMRVPRHWREVARKVMQCFVVGHVIPRRPRFQEKPM